MLEVKIKGTEPTGATEPNPVPLTPLEIAQGLQGREDHVAMNAFAQELADYQPAGYEIGHTSPEPAPTAPAPGLSTRRCQN